jgi:hypothetical protein
MWEVQRACKAITAVNSARPADLDVYFKFFI